MPGHAGGHSQTKTKALFPDEQRHVAPTIVVFCVFASFGKPLTQLIQRGSQPSCDIASPTPWRKLSPAAPSTVGFRTGTMSLGSQTARLLLITAPNTYNPAQSVGHGWCSARLVFIPSSDQSLCVLRESRWMNTANGHPLLNAHYHRIRPRTRKRTSGRPRTSPATRSSAGGLGWG